MFQRLEWKGKEVYQMQVCILLQQGMSDQGLEETQEGVR